MYCKKCLYPETKQDLWFDKNGICSAYLAFDDRKEINWQPTNYLSLMRMVNS